MHRRHVEGLEIGPGFRAAEIGCGNGSISARPAEQVDPNGRVVPRLITEGRLDPQLLDRFLAR